MILRAIELATHAHAGHYNPAVLFRERADGGPGGTASEFAAGSSERFSGAGAGIRGNWALIK